MKLVGYPWKRVALNRLILSFIGILLPLYILAIIIYNWGIQTLQTEISNSMSSQVSQYFDELESEFSRIHDLQLDLIGDPNLNRLAAIPASLNEIEKLQSMLRLQQRLNAIRNSSEYIREVHAYIPAIERDISALSVSEYERERYAELMKLPTIEEAHVVNFRGDMYMVTAYPYSVPGSKREPIFIIAIELSLDRLLGALHSMRNSLEEGLIFNSPQFTLATSRDAALNEGILQQIGLEQAEDAAQIIRVQDQRYLTVHTSSPFFGALLIKYEPVSAVFQPLAKFRNWFLMFAAVSLAIILVYSLYLYKYIHKPLDRLVRAFRKVELGDVNVHIRHESRDEFQYIYTRFNAMLENLNSLIEQVYKQRILTQKAELKQLQSQINPHFLYNSFFVLSRLIHSAGGEEKASRFSEHLGQYFQFITRDAPDDIRMEQEVKHARVYTDIQSVCYDKRIAVSFEELPAMFADVMVPRLILQPIIENAFKHAFENKLQDGRLVVRFANESGSDERPWLTVIVEDNGDLLSDAELDSLQRSLNNFNSFDEESTGLYNIHKRIQLRFGAKSGLRLSRSALGGLKATLLLALDTPNSPDA